MMAEVESSIKNVKIKHKKRKKIKECLSLYIIKNISKKDHYLRPMLNDNKLVCV